MSLSVKFTKKIGDFSLDIDFTTKTDFAVLYGPSGAGKSATLRAVAGLLTPDSGRIALEDKVWFDSQSKLMVPVQQRRVGFVFQDYALFPHLTVEKNIAFGLDKGVFGLFNDKSRRVEELSDIFELTPHLKKRVGELSGGQRQRVALARALAPEPDLLLLDEPFSALDPELKQRLRGELKRIRAEFGVTAILVTHDIEDVSALADEVVVIDDGRVARTWQLRELCRKRNVANFVGSHGPFHQRPMEAAR